MIKKSLLSKILNVKVLEVRGIVDELLPHTIYYIESPCNVQKISTFEIQHRCKELESGTYL